MRAARAEHRRPHGQRRRRLALRALRQGNAEVGGERLFHGFHRVFAGGGHVARALAPDDGRQVVLSAQVGQRALEHRVQLLHAEHLVHAPQEGDHLFLRQGEGRAHLEDGRLRAEELQRLGRVGVVDAVRRDAPAAGPGVVHEVEGRVPQRIAQRGVARLDLLVVQKGRPREDDPALRVLDKALRGLDAALVLDADRGAAVTDARGRPQEHGRLNLLGEVEGRAHHRIRLLRRGGVKDRQLGEHGERARVLLRLRGDGAGIVRHQHHHAALNAHVGQAHQRVRGHVQAHLLHGDHRPRAGIGRAGRRLHGGLFVDRPFHVDRAVVVLGHRLQHLGRGRARIARNKAHARVQRAQSDGLVAHEKFFRHFVFFPPVCFAWFLFRKEKNLPMVGKPDARTDF